MRQTSVCRGPLLLQPRQRNIRESGFTLIELITIMIVIGVLAVVALPRFWDNDVFQSRGFSDQVQAAMRYGQKVAIAQRRNVCVAFTLPAPSTITLSVASVEGSASACDTALVAPTGGAYVITAPGGIAFTALPTDFNFDASGRPTVSQTLGVTGSANTITIEAETGYVH